MKFLEQLQTWEPLVLLQSWEQVPKRRHSLMSGQREMRSGEDLEGALTDPNSAPRTPFLLLQPHPSYEITSHWQKPMPNPTARSQTLSSSSGKYLGKNSCPAPSGSLCGRCSMRWTGSGRNGPHPHTWWCWSCSRMTCALWWDACHTRVTCVSQRVPQPPPGPWLPTHRGSRIPHRSRLRSHQRSCSGGWR